MSKVAVNTSQQNPPRANVARLWHHGSSRSPPTRREGPTKFLLPENVGSDVGKSEDRAQNAAVVVATALHPGADLGRHGDRTLVGGGCRGGALALKVRTRRGVLQGPCGLRLALAGADVGQEPGADGPC